MKQARLQGNLVAYIAAAVVVSLIGIVVLFLSQLHSHSLLKPQIAFAHFGPYQVENQHFSISASVALQTGSSEISWANDNRDALNIIFKKVLVDTDINIIKAPNGLQVLQEILAKNCNAAFNTNYVQAVLLTDFVFQLRDSS